MAKSKRNSTLPEHQRRFGAHVSVAGGMATAFERAAEAGCDMIQVFVKNQRQWRAKPLLDDEVRAWHEARKASNVSEITAHNSYLINLAAPGDAPWKQSIEAFRDELIRCEQLGITGIVAHPGAHMGTGEDAGLKRIADAIDLIHAQTAGFRVRILLEITAGQGSCLGHQFDHLGTILKRVRESERLGVCFDTCHALAAGYELRTPDGYQQTMGEFDRTIGLERLCCFHVNDSLKPLASRVDRHAAIGKGHLGTAAFRLLINDPRFHGRPMLLETPKGQDERGRDLDRVNLAALRRLIAG